MPVEITTFQLPGGARCVRVTASGHFSNEDASAYVQETSPGGSLFGLPQLVLTQKQESVSAEARSVFAGQRLEGQEPWIAVVAPNPVTRVINNFLVRVMRRNRVRLFGGESEAIRWLDERNRADSGAKTGAP